MIRVALRADIWHGIGIGGSATVFLLFLTASYLSLPGTRASVGRELESLAPAFSFILPLPLRLDTLAGYLEWFGFGQFAPVFAVWAALAGAGASRGEEERGLTDQWLAAGVPRWRVVLAHAVAFATTIVMAVLIACLACSLLASALGEPIASDGFALRSIGLVALAIWAFAIGLLTGQVFPTRRGASGAAAVAVVALFLLNSLSRQFEPLVGWRWLSPFSYDERAHGLVPGVPFDTGAVAVIAAIALILTMVAVALFARRDSGSAILSSPSGGSAREPSGNALLRRPMLAALYDQRLALGVWSLAIAAQGALMVPMGDSFLAALAGADPSDPNTAQLRIITGAGRGTPYEGFLGFEWFGGLLALGVAAFAITQVARWAADEADGRLEALLSAPVSRTRVVFERAAALLLGATLLVAVGHAAVSTATAAAGVELDALRLLVASGMLVPVALVYGGVGAAVSAWRPRLAVAVMSTFAFVSFMVPFASPIVRAPEWVTRLSVFDLYGSPLSEGFAAWRFAVLATVAVLGFAIATVAIMRRDIGR